MIYSRLFPIVESEGGLFDKQLGFSRNQRSMQSLTAVVTLNVKDAVNSAKLEIIEALIKLQALFLYCDSDDELKIFLTTCGVPQGFIPAPELRENL